MTMHLGINFLPTPSIYKCYLYVRMDAFYRAKEKSVNYHEKIIQAFTALH